MSTALQALLDRSVAHVRKQGKPSAEVLDPEEGMVLCRYRSPDGASCAAAPFIIEYRTPMEGKHWAALVQKYPAEFFDAAAYFNYDFVADVLQRAHDEAAHSALVHGRDFIEAYELSLYGLVADWNTENGTSLVVPAKADK